VGSVADGGEKIPAERVYEEEMRACECVLIVHDRKGDSARKKRSLLFCASPSWA
jgi:hypothetical protein